MVDRVRLGRRSNAIVCMPHDGASDCAWAHSSNGAALACAASLSAHGGDLSVRAPRSLFPSASPRARRIRWTRWVSSSALIRMGRAPASSASPWPAHGARAARAVTSRAATNAPRPRRGRRSVRSHAMTRSGTWPDRNPAGGCTDPKALPPPRCSRRVCQQQRSGFRRSQPGQSI